MFKKKLLFLVSIMLLLSLGSYVVCHTAGTKQLAKGDEFTLVTSFYPMYVLAQNLTQNVEGIEVYNLTENQTGCLHDYQLTAKDMKLLTQADAFLINGAGMELFVEKVLEQHAELPVIEAAHGISLLEGVAHDHGHEGEEEHVHEEEEHVQEEEEHEESGHMHAENGHVWMDVDRYRQQLVTATEELKKLLPERAEQLEEAAVAYDTGLSVLAAERNALRNVTKGQYVVIFHEAFAYFAEGLGMEVIATLSLDEETVPSAGEIAEVIEEIKYHGQAFILIEEAYASHAEKIAAETGAKVIYLDPLVTGDGAADSYLSCMRENLAAVKAAVSE